MVFDVSFGPHSHLSLIPLSHLSYPLSLISLSLSGAFVVTCMRVLLSCVLCAQATLVKLQPELAKKTSETEQLLQQVAVDQERAAQVREVVETEEKLVKSQAEEVHKLQAEAQADLDLALPALNNAIKALDSLNKGSISEGAVVLHFVSFSCRSLSLSLLSSPLSFSCSPFLSHTHILHTHAHISMRILSQPSMNVTGLCLSVCSPPPLLSFLCVVHLSCVCVQ